MDSQNTKFLYGASIQGIQSFIFKTNRLKEIIGASELVEKICQESYNKLLPNLSDEQIVMTAAGNIKLILSEDECKMMVRSFPLEVAKQAADITISQAVVTLEEIKLRTAIDVLEGKLRIQRNKVATPPILEYMGIERDRQVGDAAVKVSKNGYICQSTHIKREQVDSTDSKDLLLKYPLLTKIADNRLIDDRQVSLDNDDIALQSNSFMAVVHADGNGLGALLQNMGEAMKDKSNDEYRHLFRQFSMDLEVATIKATQEAFNSVYEAGDTNKIPLRPIVLGGDDLTVLIRADLAWKFTTTFLERFKEFTCDLPQGINIKEKGLTASAGIAYIKHKFPMHYGMSLAEQLCQEAKAESERKDLSISFYKVQESYIDRLPHMRQLNKVQPEGFKAYLLNDKRFNQLSNVYEVLQGSDSEVVTGKLREWVGVSAYNPERAAFMLDRIKENNTDFFKKLETDDIQIIYDAIELNTLK